MSKTQIQTHSTKTDWSLLFRPGTYLKRWLLLLFVGITIMGLGFAFAIRESYITNQLPDFVYIISLKAWPDWARALLLLTVGFGLITLGMWQSGKTIATAFSPRESKANGLQMVNTFLQRQTQRQGPKVVAIGGGTGMPQLLRGLRRYTDNITAIVTVADDGGSSGRLRRQMGMLPPGDFRNNIAALSDAEGLMRDLFQYRFDTSDYLDGDAEMPTEKSELDGHSFGNLFIAAMTGVTGSFEKGLAESSRILSVQGRVLPSTLEQITLCARITHQRADGSEETEFVEGESQLPNTGGKVTGVYIKPESPRAYANALRAIQEADLIVAGPGSFFTSVMPNLLVPAISDTIAASEVPCIYLCNVATQPGETDHFSVTDHMRHLHQHAGDAFTTVLANHNYDESVPPSEFGQWVTLPMEGEEIDYQLFTGDLVHEERPWHHDSNKLAARLMEVYTELRSRS
ncbi:MAG: gluconeogenesis factor YvcK family protein [Chloroflexota bacterium]